MYYLTDIQSELWATRVVDVWSTSEILSALEAPNLQRAATGRLSLGVFDRKNKCGAGRDDEGRFVAVFPGDSELEGFELNNAVFEPSRVVHLEQEADEEIEVAVLRIKAIADSDTLGAISGVFASLFSVAESGGSAGRVVLLLKELFASHFKQLPGPEVVTGLVGELIVILASESPTFALRAWHSNPNDRYDFSAGTNRVEVKSSAIQRRTHHFSSSQLPPPSNVRLTVLSVLIDKVQVGSTIEDLVLEIASMVDADLRQRLVEVVTSVLKCPPGLIDSVYFDTQSARLSVKAFLGVNVPTVECGLDILSASWLSNLDGVVEHDETDVSVLLGTK